MAGKVFKFGCTEMLVAPRMIDDEVCTELFIRDLRTMIAFICFLPRGYANTVALDIKACKEVPNSQFDYHLDIHMKDWSKEKPYTILYKNHTWPVLVNDELVDTPCVTVAFYREGDNLMAYDVHIPLDNIDEISKYILWIEDNFLDIPLEDCDQTDYLYIPNILGGVKNDN
jgi:hypothetical protein